VDVFVTKLNPTGSALVYSTYLGGSGGTAQNYGQAIAVDSAGNAYVTGYTYSTNFPTTPAAFQAVNKSAYFTAFVTKFNPTGTSLVYSTYLGGSGEANGYGIAVDAAGNVYLTGDTFSPFDFPTTPDAFQLQPADPNRWAWCAFVTQLNSDATTLLYSTYLLGNTGNSGNSGDFGQAIAVDQAGNVYVTGSTASTDFPTTPGAFQTTLRAQNGRNAFVTKFSGF
jgi:hypothetical protein